MRKEKVQVYFTKQEFKQIQKKAADAIMPSESAFLRITCVNALKLKIK